MDSENDLMLTEKVCVGRRDKGHAQFGGDVGYESREVFSVCSLSMISVIFPCDGGFSEKPYLPRSQSKQKKTLQPTQVKQTMSHKRKRNENMESSLEVSTAKRQKTQDSHQQALEDISMTAYRFLKQRADEIEISVSEDTAIAFILNLVKNLLQRCTPIYFNRMITTLKTKHGLSNDTVCLVERLFKSISAAKCRYTSSVSSERVNSYIFDIDTAHPMYSKSMKQLAYLRNALKYGAADFGSDSPSTTADVVDDTQWVFPDDSAENATSGTRFYTSVCKGPAVYCVDDTVIMHRPPAVPGRVNVQKRPRMYRILKMFEDEQGKKMLKLRRFYFYNDCLNTMATPEQRTELAESARSVNITSVASPCVWAGDAFESINDLTIQPLYGVKHKVFVIDANGDDSRIDAVLVFGARWYFNTVEKRFVHKDDVAKESDLDRYYDYMGPKKCGECSLRDDGMGMLCCKGCCDWFHFGCVTVSTATVLLLCNRSHSAMSPQTLLREMSPFHCLKCSEANDV